MFGLALTYGRGLGVEANAAETACWIEKTVDAGSALGLVGAAYLYMDGVPGVPRDEAKAHQAIERALPLLEQATAAGDPDAPALLAQLYLEGKVGAASDPAKAAPLFLKGFERYSFIAIDMLRNPNQLPEETRRAAEQRLADTGFSPGPVDGVIDDATKSALDAWSKKGATP